MVKGLDGRLYLQRESTRGRLVRHVDGHRLRPPVARDPLPVASSAAMRAERRRCSIFLAPLPPPRVPHSPMASRAREEARALGSRRERDGGGSAPSPAAASSRHTARLGHDARDSARVHGGKRPNAYPTPSSGSGPGSRRGPSSPSCNRRSRLERGLDLEVGVLPRRGLEVQATHTRETVSPRDHALRRPAPDPALWGPGGGLADKESTTPRAPVLGAGRSTKRVVSRHASGKDV